ncbi:MAG: N-acetyl sugar amidotransferase [Peptococcaceae bacterium]|nr:N-acetyl sugar amidotransferase [Peptococcaceae bacterium]
MDTAGDPTITFNDEGLCNYCEDTLRRKNSEYFPTKQGLEKLEDTFEKIKIQGKGKPYDCMAGLSGGLDSSYIVYLAHQYGLRLLAVHVDDGYNTKIAEDNIQSVCAKAGVDLKIIKPHREQYADVTRAFFRARVPNLAMPQDNIINAALFDFARQYKIRYNLSGSNFALECILQRGNTANANDKRHIIELHRRFGEIPIGDLRLTTMMESYISSRYLSPIKKVYPLNYIDYNMERAIKTLEAFSGYTYYGGKHFESVLTRFLQCYYLPVKYGADKRKSHLSSMIVSGQMTREQALDKLATDPYSEEMRNQDFDCIAETFRLSRSEFEELVSLPPKHHGDYPLSRLTGFAGMARKLRKHLG